MFSSENDGSFIEINYVFLKKSVEIHAHLLALVLFREISLQKHVDQIIRSVFTVLNRGNMGTGWIERQLTWVQATDNVWIFYFFIINVMNHSTP